MIFDFSFMSQGLPDASRMTDLLNWSGAEFVRCVREAPRDEEGIHAAPGALYLRRVGKRIRSSELTIDSGTHDGHVAGSVFLTMLSVVLFNAVTTHDGEGGFSAPGWAPTWALAALHDIPEDSVSLSVDYLAGSGLVEGEDFAPDGSGVSFDPETHARLAEIWSSPIAVLLRAAMAARSRCSGNGPCEEQRGGAA